MDHAAELLAQQVAVPITIRHNGKYDAVLTPSRNKALAIPVSTRTYEASRLFAEQDYAKKKKACAKPKTDKDGYRSRQARDTAARNDVAKEFGTARIGTFVGMAIRIHRHVAAGGIEEQLSVRSSARSWPAVRR